MPRQPVLISIIVVVVVVVVVAVAACGGGDPAVDASSVQHPRTSETADAGGSADEEPAEASESPDGADGEPLDDWVTVTDEPSGASFLLPDATEARSNTAMLEDGGQVALRNYSATTDDGIELGFNIIDTPGESYDLDAGVAGVADTLGAEVVSSVDTDVAGELAVDVEMTYGEDMFVLFTLISTEDHVMQTLASGPEAERPAVEATFEHLTGSLEVH